MFVLFVMTVHCSLALFDIIFVKRARLLLVVFDATKNLHI